jgi:hypothetical protein
MPDESTPHSSLRLLQPILILSFHLHLRLPDELFHSGLQIRTWYVFVLSPTYTTCPTYLILLGLIIVMFYREYKSCSFSLRSFLSPPSIFLLSYPYIPSTRLSKTLSICSVCLFVRSFSYRISRFLLSFVSRVIVSFFHSFCPLFIFLLFLTFL